MRWPARRIAIMACAAVIAGSATGAASTAVSSATTSGPSLSVNAAANRHAISPDIYGMSFVDRSRAALLGVTLNRDGGNSASRYNYVTDTYNTGSDWYFENIPPTIAGSTDDDVVTQDKAAGLGTVLTMPTIGWVAKAPAVYNHPLPCGFPRAAFPSQDSFDPYDSGCGNGRSGNQPLAPGAPSTTSQAAGSTWDGAWVQRLVAAYGTAANGGVPIYELDNEPALWNSTHRDVHPNPLNYFTYAQSAISTAAAIKAGDPTAKVMGPSDWGWCAYFYSPSDSGGCGDGPDRQAHGGEAIAPWYLDQFKAAEQSGGTRLLDVLDEHYYRQAGGVALSGAGDANTQALRLRTTRSLWDPAYKDESWISDLAAGGVAVQLIPRMRGWIDAHYPGTKLGISEYNFGGLESINGALTQADVLGIFARERVDMAELWAGPAAGAPGEFAFRLFRNYDGAGAKFGNTWVRSTSADQAKLAVYGAQRGAKGSLTVVVVNKTGTALTSQMSVAGFPARGDVQVWRYSAADLGHIVHMPDGALTAGNVSLTYPANSMTMLVLPPADSATPVVSSGPQPGLRSFVAMASQQTLLTWAATDGRLVERYELQRSVNGVAYSALALPDETRARAWVSVSPGTSYRFRVRAFDGAGNASAWVAGPTFSESLVDDASGSVSYAGSWSAVANGAASGGTLHQAAATGPLPSVTLAFTGRAVAIVVERRTSDDLVEILVDGISVATRSLQSFAGHALDSTAPRQLLFGRSWLAASSHTITLRGHSINLDAFLVLSTPGAAAVANQPSAFHPGVVTAL